MEIRRHKCNQCGKVFRGNYSGEYAYRHNDKLFCSYGCYRAFLRESGILKESEQVIEDICKHNALLEACEQIRNTKLKSKTEASIQQLLKKYRIKQAQKRKEARNG